MESLGEYVVEGELGRGAFARVVAARHRVSGAAHALKVLAGAADPELLLRFQREAHLLARLDGQGVVGVHGAWAEPGRLVLAMDLMPGGSLRARMRGPWPWRDAAALVAELARALARCHAAGLVHRDLKPENILFDEQDRPRLADFGCARDLTAASLTVTGQWIGTPAYMAPEQLNGQRVDGRADVWALGVLLVELVTGARPWTGRDPIALLTAITSRPRPRLPGAAASLEALLDDAFALDPARRVDAAGLAAHLDAALAGAARPRRAARRLVAPLGVIALVVVAAAAWTAASPAATPSSIDDDPTTRAATRAALERAPLADLDRAVARRPDDLELRRLRARRRTPVLVDDLERLARAGAPLGDLAARAAEVGVEAPGRDLVADLVALASRDGGPRTLELLTRHAVAAGALRRPDVRACLAASREALAVDLTAACEAADQLAGLVERHRARFDTAQARVELRVATEVLGRLLGRRAALREPALLGPVLAPLQGLLRSAVRPDRGERRAEVAAALRERARVTPDLLPPALAGPLLLLLPPDQVSPEDLAEVGRQLARDDGLVASALLREAALLLPPQDERRTAGLLRAALDTLRATGPSPPADAAWRAELEYDLRMQVAGSGGLAGVAWAERLALALAACDLGRAGAVDAAALGAHALTMAEVLALEPIEPWPGAPSRPPGQDAPAGEVYLLALARAASGDPRGAIHLLRDERDRLPDGVAHRSVRQAIKRFEDAARGAGGPRSSGE